jgi:hypothetical protein
MDYRARRANAAALSGLNQSGLASRLNVMTTKSSSMCARGVRLSLNRLFGRGPGGGPDARKYGSYLSNWSTPSAHYRSIGAYEGDEFQDYDVRVLQPSSLGNPAGHVEIFYQGKWYSDFAQRGSLWNTAKHRYRSQQVYRLVPKAVAWLIEQMIRAAEGLLPAAQAAETNESNNKPKAGQHHVLAEIKDEAGATWSLVDEDRGDSTASRVYKSIGDKNVMTAEDENSPYLALSRLTNADVARRLADSLVASWIKAEGRETVQKRVKASPLFYENEKEAYLRAGLVLPKSYKLSAD